MLKKIKVSKSKRLQCQVLSFHDLKILWINCYFPCDQQNNNSDCSELIETLAEIEKLVMGNDQCEILLSGDLNFDQRRENTFMSIINSSLKKMKLESVWNNFHIDYTHTYTLS